MAISEVGRLRKYILIALAIEAKRDETLHNAERIFDDTTRDRIEWQAEGMDTALGVVRKGGGV